MSSFGLAPLKKEGAYTDWATGRELTPEEIAAYEQRQQEALAAMAEFEAAMKDAPTIIDTAWLAAQQATTYRMSDRNGDQARQYLRDLVLDRIARSGITAVVECADIVAPAPHGFSWGW